MFIMLQFPFVDLRYLSLEETCQLDVIRNLNYYTNEEEFIKCFGSKQERSWSENVVEPFFYSAKKAFSFDPYDKDNHLLFNRNTITGVSCKRLFSNKIMCKLDIGMQCKNRPYLYSNIEHLIFRILKSKIIMRQVMREEPRKRGEKRESEVFEFKKIIKKLPDYYLFATTINPKINYNRIKEYNLIQSGNSVAFVELYQDEFDNTNLPYGMRVKEIKEWDTIIYYYNSKKSELKIGEIWIIVKSIDSPKDKIRNLRIYLQKFHQQKECIDLILKYINRGKVKYDNTTLTSYIKPYLSNFLGESYYGIKNEMISNIVFDVENEAFPSYKEQLLEKCIGTSIYDLVKDILREIDLKNEKKADVLKSIYQLEEEIKKQKKIEQDEDQIVLLQNLTEIMIDIKSDIIKGNISKKENKINILNKLIDSLINVPDVVSLILNITNYL